jgi:hypothetical protein
MCGVTVHNPDKLLPKEHMAVLINSPVAGKTLEEVGVEANFISASLASSKSYRMDGGRGILHHKIEVGTQLICLHGLF